MNEFESNSDPQFDPQFDPPFDPPYGPRFEPGRNREYLAQTPVWYVAVAGGLLLIMLIGLGVLLFSGDGGEIQAVAPTVDDRSLSSAPTLPDTTRSSPTASTGTSSTSATSTTGTSGTTTSTSSLSTTTSTTTLSTTTLSTTTGSTTATTAATTATTASTSTSSTTNPDQFRSAVWPWFESDVRYDAPADAARGFAEDFLGMADPLVGPFQQGDGRSGEVEIRSETAGPITTVLVRQLGPDDSWWVLGSIAEFITIDQPDALDMVDSPLTVSGRALAFEGVVEVELRVDGSTAPLFTGVVVGGGSVMEPFSGQFTWTGAGGGFGALVLSTRSMDDDGLSQASVLRLEMAGG